MNVQLDLYDKLQSIRTKISDEEFNNLMDNFIDLYKKSNIKLLNEFYQSPTITNTINECKCSEYEICLDQDISKLKSCKNYQKFIELNPVIELIFEDKIVELTKTPILYPNTPFKIIQNNFRNLNLLGNFNYSINIIYIIGTAIFDYSMRNLFFNKMQPKETVIDILNIKNFQSNEDFNEFMKKISFDSNIWIKTFKSAIYKIDFENIAEQLTGEIINGKLNINANLDEEINIEQILQQF